MDESFIFYDKFLKEYDDKFFKHEDNKTYLLRFIRHKLFEKDLKYFKFVLNHPTTNVLTRNKEGFDALTYINMKKSMELSINESMGFMEEYNSIIHKYKRPIQLVELKKEETLKFIIDLLCKHLIMDLCEVVMKFV
jgi:hypothetical protein